MVKNYQISTEHYFAYRELSLSRLYKKLKFMPIPTLLVAISDVSKVVNSQGETSIWRNKISSLLLDFAEFELRHGLGY